MASCCLLLATRYHLNCPLPPPAPSTQLHTGCSLTKPRALDKLDKPFHLFCSLQNIDNFIDIRNGGQGWDSEIVTNSYFWIDLSEDITKHCSPGVWRLTRYS